jgi:iron-sulfur cluster assembly accessory protein
VDDISLTLLAGSTVDYTQELIRASFVVAENPNASAGCGCGASFSVEI